ncbi:MAG: hypothetical protein GEV07_18865 [Streptosporangiales bacterium]|nr:hypothetical protein [Streptosporangiales bacterium]
MSTYVNLAVRAPVDEALGVLEVAGVPGVVGPQAGEWCGVFVAGDGYGLVGAERRPLSAIALRLSDRVDSTVLMVSLFEGKVLGYDVFDRGKAIGYYVSRPGHWTDEDLPSEGGEPDVLATACGLPGVQDELAPLLDRDAEDDEVRRHARLTELLALPPYLVGTGTGDVRSDGIDYVALQPQPVPRKDMGRMAKVAALGLLCFALFAWVQAFHEASWGNAVLAGFVTVVALVTGWFATGDLRARTRRQDREGETA